MHRPISNRNNLSQERGALSLEFAFVLTLVLFPLMFGILDFSRALYAYHWVSYAAREGTRWASVRGATCTLLPGGCPATAAQVQTFVQSIVAPGIYYAGCTGSTKGCISVTTTWPGTGGDGTSCTNSGNTPSNSSGCIVKVQVNYYFGFSFPFLYSETGKTMNLQSTSQFVISH
jgi:hypothetical protein